MNRFACLPSEERSIYFQETADRLDWSPGLVEKDFWVCWILKQLFSLKNFGEHLTFKGGTSLSKVFNVIQRFSEDVDISIEREFLGFGGSMEPEAGGSNKEKNRRINALQQECQSVIINKIMPQLNQSVQKILGRKEKWSIELDPEDTDKQTLLFQFPNAMASNVEDYLRPVIKIEFGARSDHWPTESAEIKSYLADIIPDAMVEKTTVVRVLAAERTFWEKATILHMLYNHPEDKQFPPRMSRHYYDTYEIAQTPILEQALNQMDLLMRVAEHKELFFRSAWARYDEVREGKALHLVPKKEQLNSLELDYRQMQPMFFKQPPEFERMIEALHVLETKINRLLRKRRV